MRALIYKDGQINFCSEKEEVSRAFSTRTLVWIALDNNKRDELDHLSKFFSIHPLVVEDLWHQCQQPKIEDYSQYLYIVAHGVKASSSPIELELEELDLIFGSHFIISHTDNPTIAPSVMADLQRNPKLMSGGPAWIAHSMLDRLVDAYFPFFDRYEAELDDLEAEIMTKAGMVHGPNVMRRIFAFKRGLQALRRTALHQREVLLRLSRTEFDEIPKEAAPFFRDVFDHFSRVMDLADGNRDILTNLLEAYLSVQSNRMNEIMKTLTLMSTTMLPLTFIAGIYGMNFDVIPELHWKYGYVFALTLMFVVAMGIFLWFRKKKWI